MCRKCRSEFFPGILRIIFYHRRRVARYRYPWEDRKKVLSQLPLTWTSWWKTAFPGDFSGTDGLKCMGNWCKHRNGRCWGQKVFFFKKWLLTHVFGGFQGHKSSASKLAPDASKFTRFKQYFLSDLQSMFNHLVNLTEPICQKRNPDLAGMTIFDTSGIETWVTGNNPKYANRIIKQLKVFKKSHNRLWLILICDRNRRSSNTASLILNLKTSKIT